MNANTSHPCIDCGVLAVVTIVQTNTVAKRPRQWHVCARCYFKRGEGR